ncbi:hypothetical protein [Clostridium felsineum]|uniref:hypothetical protein n=1 Tax=Clostridium felsineum TaxID=36839 RepID=UPI00098CBFEC|nr:hypothetical protein [Clostridium felsineum]URZ15786.1 hypothetical protein CLFE_018330 [Clostridium felsineum DSM 794]
MAMDKYKAVEYMLCNYKIMKVEIKNIDLDLKEFENEYRGCGAVSFEEKTGQTYKFNSVVENELELKNRQIEYLKRMRDSKQRKIDKIDNALTILDEEQRTIIELRYFSNTKIGWLNICNKLELSDVTCRNIKNEAIKKLIHVIFVSNFYENLSEN